MSIVDAIQKAKQLGQNRATAVERAILTPSSAVPVAAETSRAAAKTNEAVSMHEVASEPVKFEELAYDVATCTDNHIIVPHVESHMAQMGSPSYRMLRARILQRCRTHQWSKLAITSPGPGEGKSVTALNLAISLAREGNYDVFLVDLDMRNPSICRYLGVTPKHDITNFFTGDVSAKDIFFNIGIDRLTIAGATLGTTHASELLATDHLEELLAFIRRASANPLILIDLPPVLNTDDALVVAPRIDATILVVSEGITKRDGLERAVGLLSEYAVAGVVLNRANESLGSEYYGA